MRQIVGFGDQSTGRGTLGANLWRAIVTNGDFTAYVCNSAATRPSSQITLGKLVIIIIKGIYKAQGRLRGHKCAMSVETAVW